MKAVKIVGTNRSVARLVFWSAAISLFGWAVWRRFSLPLDPIVDADTWGYLAPALSKLTGGEFVHVFGRNWVYPAFLLTVLGAFADLRAITIAQHLFGIAAGGIAIVTWRRTAAFFAQPKDRPLVHDILGALFVAAVLLAGEPIRAEMQIRPEGVCTFLLSLNLYCAIEFVARAFVERKKHAVAFGVATGVTAIVLASVKPSFGFLTLELLLLVAIFFFTAQPLRRKITLGVGLLIGAAVLLVPEHILSRTDELGRAFLPTTLFTHHAHLIRDQMKQDLERRAPLPYGHERVQRIHDELAAQIERSASLEAGKNPSMGFSPGFLMYDEQSIAARVAREFNNDLPAAMEFYRFYYWRTFGQRPFAMVKKIAGQMAVFYTRWCPAFDRGKYLRLDYWYALSPTNAGDYSREEIWRKFSPAKPFLERTASLATTAPPIEQPSFVRKLVVFLAAAYLPLLALTIGIAVATFIWRKDRARFGWFVVLTLFVFSSNAAINLETGAVGTMDISRYSTVQFYICALAEFLALRLLFEIFYSRIRWGRPIQTSTPGE